MTIIISVATIHVTIMPRDIPWFDKKPELKTDAVPKIIGPNKINKIPRKYGKIIVMIALQSEINFASFLVGKRLLSETKVLPKINIPNKGLKRII